MLSQDSLDSSHLAQWTVVTRLQIGIYKTLTWLCLARESKITKSLSLFMGSDQRSNDQGGGLSPDILVSSWSRVITEGLRWSPLHMWCCHWPSPSETDTERDHSDSGLRWAPSHRDQGESAAPVSQSGFRLAHNKHTRTANNFSDWWSITNSTSQSHKSGEAPNKIVQYNYTHIQNTNAKCHADCRSTLDVDNCMVKGFTRNLNHDYKESLPRILLRNEN